MLHQAFGPQASAAGEFEHVAGGSEDVKGAHDVGYLVEPAFVQFFAVVEAALAVEPLVVFAGTGAVVVDLIMDYAGVFHSACKDRMRGERTQILE